MPLRPNGNLPGQKKPENTRALNPNDSRVYTAHLYGRLRPGRRSGRLARAGSLFTLPTVLFARSRRATINPAIRIGGGPSAHDNPPAPGCDAAAHGDGRRRS